MNKRAMQLLMLALAVTIVASLMSPVFATAAPLDEKQAEAAQLEQQITENGRRMDALNEQINSAQIALDEANGTIVTADLQVAAATAKAKDLRAQLAERAVSVYRQSSSGGVSSLDAKSTTELGARSKYTSIAAQREKQLVNQLADAKDELAARKADAEDARAVAEKTQAQIQSNKADLAAGDNRQRALLSQVKGDIATLVAKQEAERRAAEEAADARPTCRHPGVDRRRQQRRRRQRQHRRRWQRGRQPCLHAQHSPAVTERWSGRGGGVRVRPARQALLLRRRRAQLLRLLGAHDDGVGPVGRGHAARVDRAIQHVPPRAVEPAAAR